jgi:hypothetical protein
MKNFTLLIALSLLYFNIDAQIKRIATTPTAITSQIPGYSQVTTITTKTYSYTPSIPVPPPIPIDDDSTTEDSKLYRYADNLPVNLSIADGNITSTSIGKVWTIRLSIPNALNIGLSFSQFNLSASAQMYIFNEARTVLDSSIIKSKFTYSTTVGISPFKSNSIIIYIVEPGNFGTLQSAVSIQNLEAGFQQIDDVGDANGGTFSPATINCDPMILCQLEKINSARTVAKFISNGYEGTGTLINDENNDGRAYFLTAFHVVDVNNNKVIDASEIAALQNARFQFQFWRTICNGTINNTFIQFDGATLRASSPQSDVILLELLNQPGIGDGVNYAGWNRTTSSASNTLSFIIHHPNGEDMRITTTKNVRSWLYNSSYWTAHYSSGTVAPGSSGSALMNENNQIVGQLKGGWSSCNYTSFGDRYGKFSTSWGGASLQPWLSPNQALQSTSTLVLSPFVIQGNDALNCAGQTPYSVPNLLSATYNWQVSSNLQISSGQGTPAIMITNLGGSSTGTITATINTPTKGYTRTLSVTKTVTVGSPNSLTGTYSTNTNTYPIQTVNFVPSGFISGQFQWPQVSNISVTLGSGSTGTGFYTAGNTFSFTLASGQAMYLNFNGTGLCGDPVSASRSFIQSGFAIVASPNPVTDNVTVAIKHSNTLATSNTKNSKIYQLRIIDENGNVKKLYQYSSGIINTTVSMSGLIKGAYTIQAFDGKTWSSVKVIKQ